MRTLHPDASRLCYVCNTPIRQPPLPSPLPTAPSVTLGLRPLHALVDLAFQRQDVCGAALRVLKLTVSTHNPALAELTSHLSVSLTSSTRNFSKSMLQWEKPTSFFTTLFCECCQCCRIGWTAATKEPTRPLKWATVPSQLIFSHQLQHSVLPRNCMKPRRTYLEVVELNNADHRRTQLRFFFFLYSKCFCPRGGFPRLEQRNAGWCLSPRPSAVITGMDGLKSCVPSMSTFAMSYYIRVVFWGKPILLQSVQRSQGYLSTLARARLGHMSRQANDLKCPVFTNRVALWSRSHVQDRTWWHSLMLPLIQEFHNKPWLIFWTYLGVSDLPMTRRSSVILLSLAQIIGQLTLSLSVLYPWRCFCSSLPRIWWKAKLYRKWTPVSSAFKMFKVVHVEAFQLLICNEVSWSRDVSQRHFSIQFGENNPELCLPVGESGRRFVSCLFSNRFCLITQQPYRNVPNRSKLSPFT